MAVVGCQGCGDRRTWETIRIGYTGGQQDCRVRIFTPPYARGQADSVQILWDNKEIFNGTLPSGVHAPDGMPIQLIEIFCGSGGHVLEVKHGSDFAKKTLNLADKDCRRFKIFGLYNGREVLLEELDNTVRFY